MLSKELPHY